MSNSWPRQSIAFDKSVSKSPKVFPLSTDISTFLAFLKTQLCTKALSETTLIFQKYVAKKLEHLCQDALFKYFWQVRKDTYWSIVTFNIFFTFLVRGYYICEFKIFGEFSRLYWTVKATAKKIAKNINFLLQNRFRNVGALRYLMHILI